MVSVPCGRDTNYPKTRSLNSNAGEKSTTEFETFKNCFQHLPGNRTLQVEK